MWGSGGRFYWGRREPSVGKVEGIVVVFAWMSSQDRHLKNYVDLYSSLGWNSLVCHSQFLNLFFPGKATALAFGILNELVEIIEGKCEAQVNQDEYRLVRDCVSGHIYDSSPVDFTSNTGTQFVLHPTVIKMSNPPRLASWIAHGIASSLDTLFLSRFESQRAEYWQTLYSSVSMGAPYLILCSEDDDLAPYPIIYNFSKRLQDLGADVKLVKWNSSPHVGHYRHYPIDYKAAVTELLGKAAVIYSHRIRQLEGEGMGFEGTQNEITEPFFKLKRAATNSNKIQRVALEVNDPFLAPSSQEYHEDRAIGSVQDENKEGLIHMPSSPGINAHGVLGQILFDVCVPKNVEDWDIRSSPSLKGPPFGASRWHFPPNPIKCRNAIKCIRRSRL
ncbi:uncharacterized protein LOC127808693 isoform X2 [Diospyros lotus]|uniref:uncharacterized protein LOC127808693 isoform X2 n=1 Tax=Diospyros lotus TaxID=55363 RepID=UPI00224EE5D8|nr:uncharacterized protein LOC127808693 isoform X2 [Diospyros lotus]